MVVSKMKAEEIREMSNDQLESKLVSLKEELFYLRMKHATRQLDNPLQIQDTKKDIARVKTILRERQPKPEEVSAK